MQMREMKIGIASAIWCIPRVSEDFFLSSGDRIEKNSKNYDEEEIKTQS